MHVTCRKLALKFTGYCRQTSYTDSAVVFTLLPAVAWDLKSQFPGGYMHFNICFKGVSGKIGIFHNEKLPIEVFWFFCLFRPWQWAGANTGVAAPGHRQQGAQRTQSAGWPAPAPAQNLTWIILTNLDCLRTVATSEASAPWECQHFCFLHQGLTLYNSCSLWTEL